MEYIESTGFGSLGHDAGQDDDIRTLTKELDWLGETIVISLELEDLRERIRKATMESKTGRDNGDGQGRRARYGRWYTGMRGKTGRDMI